ncbi:MAG TPA: hypothetical protein VEK57_06190 [Thermoanaerobaculia bacterium]|nr:hypothetical protein [Thermoanaerobaculia bacterium]
MKRTLTLTLVVSLFIAAGAFAEIDGAWTAARNEKHPDRLYVNITRGHFHNNGSTFRISEFTGLTAATIDAAVMTPVQFSMRREAGNVAFEGTFRKGKGAGQLTFTANRGYIDAIRNLGVEFKLGRNHGKTSEEEELFTLALHDVSTAFIRSMQAEGFKVSLDKYLEMRIFDITPAYIQEMRALGFGDISNKELVESKIHNVTPKFVRDMRAQGWNLTLNQYQNAAIHGATPQFAEELKKAGYGGLDHDDIVNFRIHRVTPEYIAELRALGYDKIPAHKLVEMRIHRVTPEFIRELKAAGYAGVPINKLVQMRIAGIDGKYLKKMGNE